MRTEYISESEMVSLYDLVLHRYRHYDYVVVNRFQHYQVQNVARFWYTEAT